MVDDRRELTPLDFSLIKEQFDSLRIAMGNKVEREWPKTGKHAVEGGRALILGLYKAAENSLGASRFLMADTPKTHARRPEYAVAASPLSRSVLDALCSILFLFGSFKDRVLWYYKAGWREVLEETERLKAAYGADPEWADNLAERAKLIEHGRHLFGVTAAESSGATPIKRWPIPERMLKEIPASHDRFSYIRYLIDWFYRSLSQDAHHSWAGLARSLPLLVRDDNEEKRQLHLEIIRTKQVNVSLTLMMAIITELELEFRFGLADRAKVVWKTLRGWSDEAREIYDRFYKPILGPPE